LQLFAGRFNDSNSSIIVLDDSVVVVDTQTTLTATRAILDQIRKITDKPVRWVINTHWQGDHVQGNQVYREAFPNVQFVAQASTREAEKSSSPVISSTIRLTQAMGSHAGLVKTLHELDPLNFDLLIPGHGGTKKGHEHLHRVTSLFESIVAQVQDDVRMGLGLEDTKKEVDVESFRASLTCGEGHASRAFDGWVPVAIERAHLETKAANNK
jgi:glyoxylase-like metal-dependent hydrolase (beta-lactamase superfamily II)